MDQAGGELAGQSAEAPLSPSGKGAVWYRSTWFLGLVGSLLLWAAFPPWGIWPLAWIAPLSWLVLVAMPRLSGRRPYWVLWGVSLMHWLMLLQGIRLAHWATYFGWIALSMYLAAYLPAFVGLTRLAVHRLRWPLALAAPVIWTGLELARGHLLTGFSLALLGHTQSDVLPIVQVADVFGAYGVGFLVMLCAAGMLDVARKWWPAESGGPRVRGVPWSALVAALAVVLAVVYGGLRMRAPVGNSVDGSVSGTGSEPTKADLRDTLNVALLQRSAETIFEYDPQRNLDVYYEYRQLAVEAIGHHPDLDLIVWPESVYTANLRELLVDGPLEFPPDMELTPDEFRSRVEQWRLAFEAKNQDHVQVLQDEAQAARSASLPGTSDSSPPSGAGAGVWSLVGTDVERIRGGQSSYYNTAMLLDSGGAVAGRYYKMHPVMFGEYVPLGDIFPWLYKLTPLPQGLSRGQTPQCFEVAGFRLAPNICFESTVPHLIRRHVVELGRQGKKPDILVTITNDGWFHGSSILDLHLACSVFRAVENRRPVLIAANTGITAWINGDGRVCGQIDPLDEDFLVARVQRDDRQSWYTRFGDLPAFACLLLTIVAGVWGAVASRKVANSGE